MILSVIIVNYRVRYFLELCLRSLEKTLATIGPAEIIVVDNHSEDGSVESLVPLFPAVRFIGNRENVGFAKANNQALREATGEYILFLNPDTLLPEDFARVCLDFFHGDPRPAQAAQREQHPAPGNRGIGALGVRMIDGSGRFLPESRRGFPSPWVAFCKLSGLSAVFPRSRVFARYYLGHLPTDRTAPAPVLSGACLWTRRDILRETGGFDERFFMYAEDIDLSYRIEQAGYTNYYLADTTIIHFKGESTQKDIRYIRQFYKAMSQFRRKHFDRGLPALWNRAMEGAIWVRAGIGGLSRAVKPAPQGARAGAHGMSGGEGGPRTANHIWLTGDPDEVAQVRRLLAPEAKAGVDAGAVATHEHEATQILFCQGATFSFRQCITALETGKFYKKGQRALFHATGARSAVGSADRDGRGETLVF
jgi:N-acetylglucosaminyl-diphospho-decaprenol L-rhamnosyltransferase